MTFLDFHWTIADFCLTTILFCFRHTPCGWINSVCREVGSEFLRTGLWQRREHGLFLRQRRQGWDLTAKPLTYQPSRVERAQETAGHTGPRGPKGLREKKNMSLHCKSNVRKIQCVMKSNENNVISFWPPWTTLLRNWSCSSLCLYHLRVLSHHSNDHAAHYSDIIMSAIASKINGASIVYLIVCSGADKRKRRSSASLAFARGIHQWPVNSTHGGDSNAEFFLVPFDDVIMYMFALQSFLSY